MTISILARDEESGSLGSAAATGSLCVGGWVLRGDLEAGLSASQGALPSTLWGEDVLAAMRAGQGAAAAVAGVVAPDPGREMRQLSALDAGGGTGAHTGTGNTPAAGARTAPEVIVAGNLLASEAVLDACLDGFLSARGDLAARLLAALDAAAEAGGDSRGFQSAALLVLARDAAPLTLRIDRAERPLADLRALHLAATTGDYAAWAAEVPTRATPWRGAASRQKADHPA
ncbi:DUF1028 domain-containing protein [Jannaschia seohaensis]|uniref:Putative Ntn-hydrolase superfamily protein n=1 Tax=Jannaschia seohaensis TaxID=475081 RepID=A0A2Y9B4P8_9RHOB|nr:DUF1028 domain-containing protein [Jannaschia seohaensis]PWJ11193.1 putative Ntn-hydrolase superfamily protein [Jannaschia seohaensis]SSA51494.1 Uncharacterized conserved protein, Ntn-hydrolase superfamily [Jannaschia seohaensis]